MFILVVGGTMADDTSRDAVTVGELRMLTEDAKKAKDVERAVRHLRAIQSKLQDQEARAKVQEEIRALELQSGR